MVNPARMNCVPASPARVPRVAVIVPAYGVAHLLGEALESLLAQSMTEWECVVVDDGARDDVAGAAAPYLADPRIRLLATDNRGVSAARNRAVRKTERSYRRAARRRRHAGARLSAPRWPCSTPTPPRAW